MPVWSNARVGTGPLTRPGRDAFCRGSAFSCRIPISDLVKTRSLYPRIPALERDHQFIRALDFVFSLQKFVAPWFAGALWALVDGTANSETVIARSFGAGAREFLTSFAGLEKLGFSRSVLSP